MTIPVQMAIGSYRFQVSRAAYQQLQQKHAWRWSKVERAVRAPSMQFVGPDLCQITLDGVIYPKLHGGWRQIDTLKVEAEKRRPLPLVSGFGEVFGDFVVVGIEALHSRFLIGNAAGQIDFTINLTEYVRDPSEGGK